MLDFRLRRGRRGEPAAPNSPADRWPPSRPSASSQPRQLFQRTGTVAGNRWLMPLTRPPAAFIGAVERGESATVVRVVASRKQGGQSRIDHSVRRVPSAAPTRASEPPVEARARRIAGHVLRRPRSPGPQSDTLPASTKTLSTAVPPRTPDRRSTRVTYSARRASSRWAPRYESSFERSTRIKAPTGSGVHDRGVVRVEAHPCGSRRDEGLVVEGGARSCDDVIDFDLLPRRAQRKRRRR